MFLSTSFPSIGSVRRSLVAKSVAVVNTLCTESESDVLALRASVPRRSTIRSRLANPICF